MKEFQSELFSVWSAYICTEEDFENSEVVYC